MSDYLLAVAAALDAAPPCSCVQTDRGTDTFGCDHHDTPPPAAPARAGLAGAGEGGLG